MGVDLSLDPLGNRVRDGGQRVQLAAARCWRTGAMTMDCPFPTGDQDSTVTQLVIRRSARPRPYHCGRGLTSEPPRGIEPRTCSLRA
jgi:hypothetical protein